MPAHNASQYGPRISAAARSARPERTHRVEALNDGSRVLASPLSMDDYRRERAHTTLARVRSPLHEYLHGDEPGTGRSTQDCHRPRLDAARSRRAVDISPYRPGPPEWHHADDYRGRRDLVSFPGFRIPRGPVDTKPIGHPPDRKSSSPDENGRFRPLSRNLLHLFRVDVTKPHGGVESAMIRLCHKSHPSALPATRPVCGWPILLLTRFDGE